jgi:ATP-dependent DNA helicase RecG
LFVKEKEKISNKEYQTLNNISHKTAYRDIEKLVEMSIFEKKGDKRGTYYILNK